MASLTRERLSRGLFVLPTLFTVGNLFCGYLSIWSSIRGTFDLSAYLIIAAGILDMLDGRIARMTHSTSAFGEQYDSMADLVSFGVAPAVLAYSWGLADFHRLGWMVSFLFVVCGSMRLARFNIQVHVVDKR
jgi:CDP-diacylglycerol--serine O-phosphatidyltransferase